MTGLTNSPINFIFYVLFTAESVAQDLVKNALKAFADHKITELYDVASERMVSLSEEFHSKEKIHELVSQFDAYKCH